MTTEPGRNLAIRVTWLDETRTPQHPANPAYPNGIDVDCSGGVTATCTQALPYPAKGCGQYLLVCETCGLKNHRYGHRAGRRSAISEGGLQKTKSISKLELESVERD